MPSTGESNFLVISSRGLRQLNFPNVKNDVGQKQYNGFSPKKTLVPPKKCIPPGGCAIEMLRVWLDDHKTTEWLTCMGGVARCLMSVVCCGSAVGTVGGPLSRAVDKYWVALFNSKTIVMRELSASSLTMSAVCGSAVGTVMLGGTPQFQDSRCV